jgi:hypothetical protein
MIAVLMVNISLHAEIPESLKRSYELLYGDEAKNTHARHLRLGSAEIQIAIWNTMNELSTKTTDDTWRLSMLQAGVKIMKHFAPRASENDEKPGAGK